MKRHFGTLLTRSFLGSGTDLTDIEHRVTEELIASLPDWLRTTVEAQMESYDLVQREVDGRALNFYRKRSGRKGLREGRPLLEMHGDEAPLMRITIRLGEDQKPLHATLHAVLGEVFCVALNRRIDSYPGTTTLSVVDRKEAWRSNFPGPDRKGEQAGAPNP
jgi:hypothetical protein